MNFVEKNDVAKPNEPMVWRIDDGLLYAEASAGTVLRPPLLSDWEQERARSFRNVQRRNQWLAGRTLAKGLLREWMQAPPTVEIREGASGEPVVYRNGLPVEDVWLSIGYRGDRIAAAVSNRPIAIDVRGIEHANERIVSRFTSRGESRQLRRAFRHGTLACAIGWAVKEAAVRAMRRDRSVALSSVQILDPRLNLRVAGTDLRAIAIRIIDSTVIAIVGAATPGGNGLTQVMADTPINGTRQRSAGPLERSLGRMRRLSDARARWDTLRWQT